MAKFHVVCVAAVTSLLLFAPGTILVSSARSLSQQKYANEAYKALNVDGLQTGTAQTPSAPLAEPAAGDQRIWPGVPGIAPPQKMVGKPQPELLWY